MNKLILTLGFGILASSAFAGDLEQNAENAHKAYTHAKAAGNLGKDLQTGEKFEKNEHNQKDLRSDAQISAKMAHTSVFSKGQAMSDGKKAFSTDAA
jgi:hypothetical protein